MKTKSILTILVLAGLMFCLAEVGQGAPIGTAFTYQGRLYNDETAAEEEYDFSFRLYDSDIDGNKVGTDVNIANKYVTDGYFTVELDFDDANAFNGEARWLEVGIREGGLEDPNEYTTLSPRQEITPSPYAIYAPNTTGGTGSTMGWEIVGDDMFTTPIGNIGIGTTSPQSKLTIEKVGSDGPMTPSPATVKIKGYQNDGFASSHLRLVKSRGGSVGTNATTQPLDELGIVDGYGVNTSNTEGLAAQILFQQPDGSAGQLYVPGSIIFKTSDGIAPPMSQMGIASGGVTVWNSMTLFGMLDMGGNGISNVADPVSSQDAATKNYVDAGDADWNWFSGSGMSGDIYHSGKVGIGTSSVGTRKLKVAGDIESTGVFYGNGSGLTGIAGDNLGNHTAGQNIHLNGYYLSGDGDSEGVYVKNDGDVGIGKSNPGTKLDVSGVITATEGNSGEWNTAYGWGNHASAGYLTSEDDPQVGTNSSNYVPKWDGSALVTGSIYDNGNIGIGTSSPSGVKLAIKVGSGEPTVNNINIERQGVNDYDIYVDGSGNFLIRDGHSGPTRFLVKSSGDVVMGIDCNVGIGTSSPGKKLDVEGTTRTEVLEITGGSDLAERFDISSTCAVEAGMVVSIDRENPGKLVVSNSSYDRSVAGVVSGAGGVNTGMLMGQDGTNADGAYPVALTGRVWCRADASYGPIEPGDLLSSSDTAGHAMKVTDYAKAQGAILGKAMSSLAKGQGLVLILVNLQ